MSSTLPPWNGPLVDPNCDPAQQQAVQQQLDSWYDLDGRSDPSHPLHNLYCGLAAKYRTESTDAA